MKLIVSENQLKKMVETLTLKKPVSGGYEATKNEYIKLAQSKDTYGFGEGKSQDQNIAKEKAIFDAQLMLKSKTGKTNPNYIIKDSLYKLDDGYHQLIVIELG